MENYVVVEKKAQNKIIAIVGLSVFMFCLDYSMLNISLPSIARYFKSSIGSVSLLPLAYMLVLTSTALLFGKLGDIIGFKKIFIAGILIFISGSFLCGLAPALNMLLGLRIFQCFGEAMFNPIGVAIITTFLPSQVRGKALGIIATAQGLGFCLGPLLGGFIDARFNWHGIFFINIPLGLCLCAASLKALPSAQPKAEKKQIDFPGAALIFMTLSALIYALNSLSNKDLKIPVLAACFAVSAAALALFILRERKATNPLLDLSLFRNSNFTYAAMSTFCAMFVYMGLIFLLPFYLSMVRGLDTLKSGLLLMSPACALMLFAPIGGRIADKAGARPVCFAGMALTAFAFFLFSFFTPSSPVFFMLPSLVVAGMAVGFFLPSNNKLVMMLAPEDRQGMASAVYKIVISLGGVFGIALMPFVLIKKIYAKAAAMNIDIGTVRQMPDVLITGFDAAFKFAAIICLAGLLFAFLAKDKKERPSA